MDFLIRIRDCPVLRAYRTVPVTLSNEAMNAIQKAAIEAAPPEAWIISVKVLVDAAVPLPSKIPEFGVAYAEPEQSPPPS